VAAAALAAGPMPEDLWQCVRWSHREPVRAHQDAANAVQFDLLLIITKPVIPLFMLIALGQVWNGLFSSLFIGHALRRWVPQMSYETHHLLCAFFGIMHTLLAVSAQQVEDYANASGLKILHLVWSWSFKDVLTVMHMAMLGATVTAMAGLGNEPSYAASFAAGIAMRIAIGQDSISGLGLVRDLAGRVEVGLREMGVALDQAEEVVAYSGNGIGDCGGGPFRMLFGDGPEARWASFALKLWLGLLPFLSTLQWLQRTVHAGRNIGNRCHLPSDEQEQQQEEYLSDWPADVERAQKGLEGAPEEHGHPEVSQCTVRCIQLNIRDHDALHYAKYTEDDTLNKPLQFKLLADVPACMDCPLQPLQC